MSLIRIVTISVMADVIHIFVTIKKLLLVMKAVWEASKCQIVLVMYLNRRLSVYWSDVSRFFTVFYIVCVQVSCTSCSSVRWS